MKKMPYSDLGKNAIREVMKIGMFRREVTPDQTPKIRFQPLAAFMIRIRKPGNSGNFAGARIGHSWINLGKNNPTWLLRKYILVNKIDKQQIIKTDRQHLNPLIRIKSANF